MRRAGLGVQSNDRKPAAFARAVGADGGYVENHAGPIDPKRKAVRHWGVRSRRRARIEQSLDLGDGLFGVAGESGYQSAAKTAFGNGPQERAALPQDCP